MELAQAQSPGVGDPISGIADLLLSQGLMGAVVLMLIYFILILRAEMKDLRQVHRTELAAKEALIHDLMEERLKEAKVGYDVAHSSKASLDALLAAIRTKG